MTADINEVVAQIRKGDKIGLLVYLHHGGDANARNSMGWTLLHIACFEGKTEIVEILLDNGAQVNACTTDMATPLHRASSQGCRGAVAALLNKNAYVNAQDKNGNTALHEAARGAYTSIVKALINQKADKEKLNNRKQKFTDLVGQQLMPAVASGDTETLALWLDWGLSPNTCGSLGWSLLHHASVSGQAEVAALLIDRGANLETLDSNKSSALHAASFHGSKDIVKLLLKNGANPNLQDQRGNTPLHSAVSGSHAEIINLLLEGGADTSIANHENMVFKHIVKDVLVKTVHEGKTSQVTALLKGHADPDTRDAFGTPLICVAAFNKDLLIVDALLEAGADPNLSSTDSKKTALHYAAFWDDLFIIKSLLDRKAKIDPVDRFGNTPLHEAASEGHVDVITMLTGRLAAINTPNLDGNTPLHLAAKAGETAAVELLLEKTANESFLNKNGQLYSDLALINAVRTEMPDKVMAGLAWGGDPNTKDQKGWTLLHHAVFKGSLEITSMLLECGAEVDEVDIHGRTALIVAAYRGNCAIASRLIDAGANMERQDLEGQTALHWAAREGSVETVLCLIDHGADTAIKDNAGRFFKHWLVKHLYLAVRHTDPEKVEALLSAGADQFTRVEGTDVTPREEAKRRKSFSILKLMVARSQLTHTYEEEFDFWNMPAIEDLRVLFKGEDSSDEDSEEEAEWKMKNAEVVVSAKELFADDNNELWEVWDEKPKWITSKELCQEDVQDFWQSWEETSEKPRQRSRSPPPPARSNDDSETESDEETDESGNSNEDEVRKPLEELQQDAEEPEVVQRVLVRMPAALDSSLEESGECEPIVEEYKGMNTEDDPRVTELFDEILMNLLDYHPEERSVEYTVTSDVCVPTPMRNEIIAHISTSSDALASDDHKNSLDIPSAVTRLTSTEAIDESPINVFEVNDRNDRIDETFHHCESEVIRNTQLLQNDHSMQNKDLQNVLMKDDVTDFSPCYSDNGKKDNEQHLISKTPTASSFSGFQTRKSCSPLPETQESLTSRENTSSLAQNFASLPELKTFLYSSLDVDKILEPEVKSVRETCLVKCRALLSQNKPNNEVVDEQENSHRSNLSPTSETHTVAFTDSEAVSVPKNKLKEEENKFKNDSPLNPQFSLEDVDDAGHALLPSTSVTQGDSYGIDEVQPTPDFSETEIAVVVPEEDTHREMKPKPKNSSDDGKDSALMSFISFCVFILFITSYLLLKWFT